MELNPSIARTMKQEADTDRADAVITRVKALVTSLSAASFSELENLGDLPLSGLEPDLKACELAGLQSVLCWMRRTRL